MTPAEIVARLIAIAPGMFPSVEVADTWRALIADAKTMQAKGMLK